MSTLMAKSTMPTKTKRISIPPSASELHNVNGGSHHKYTTRQILNGVFGSSKDETDGGNARSLHDDKDVERDDETGEIT